MALEPLLKTDNLVKHFPFGSAFLAQREYVQAVDGVSLILQQEETLSLVGESGCGKTTVGRLILKLIEPTAGRIWYRGIETTNMKPKEMRPLRSEMQIVFQDPWSSLNPRMTVKSIIGEGLRFQSEMGRKERKAKILEAMARVGLRPEHYNRHPHEFSGGQRQRVGIARALIMGPKLVVADEPVSALDVSVQAQVLNLLKGLKDEFGLSYLFISHDLSVVEYISDQIAVMYLGRIVESAPCSELFCQPHHPYTEALFSAAPVVDPRSARKRIILKGDVPSPVNPPTGCRFHPRCNYAQNRCKTDDPVLSELSSGRWVACHFPLG